MKFFFHPQARDELEQAIQFYMSQQAGLEMRFLEAVDDAFKTATGLLEKPQIAIRIDLGYSINPQK